MRLARPLRASLSAVPVADLHAEIQRRERRLAELKRKHAAMMAKLGRLEAMLATLGGAEGKSSRRGRRSKGARPVAGAWVSGPALRVRNAIPLHTAMHAELKGKTMNAAEVGEALLRSGFRTTSKNFRQLLALTFIKHPDLFRRVARGMYTAK